MDSINITVYDDVLEIAQGWASKIQDACSGANVDSATREDFESLLKEINRRRRAWRAEPDVVDRVGSHPIDDADVVVVDYDLFQFAAPLDATGSRIAYLLRCYTRCGVIIVLNQFGINVFDLSLGQPTQGFADVHLGNVQIGNVGLWKAQFEGYRPWYWPVVTDITADFERCVLDVQKNLDEPIVSFLGLERVIDWIPRRARRFLSRRKEIERVTFREFVETSVGGVTGRDKLIPEQIARVGAARIRLLLNAMIIPDQYCLVDAPHLASRLPSVIAREGNDMAMWNRLCVATNDEIDDLVIDHLERYRFKRHHWLWRPAWFWPEIRKDEGFAEVQAPWTQRDVDWVFCEDLSQFVPVEYAQQFQALVAPPFTSRFLFDRKSADAREYLRQSGSGKPDVLSGVEYVPEAAFSL